MGYKYHKDNREFIEDLKKTGDVVVVEREVDWDLEMGAIVRRVCERKAPAPYFKKVKDYPEFEAFGAPLATYRRLAVALGLDPDTPIPEIGKVYLERTSGEPIKPVVVEKGSAPCKENVLLGDDVDLFKLPAPMVHDGDGGRYIGTWHFVVARDPESDFVNWGMYRQMVVDEKTMAGPVFPFSDMGKIFYNKYAPRGEPMPFATVIGCSPLAGIAASAPAPCDEPDFCGMLQGEPVEVVKCETSDLYVPAHAEVIIEGEILPGVEIEEAPFGEYTGHRTSPRAPRTVYRVKAITFRDRAIMTMSNMGMPVDEGQLLRSFTLGLELEKLLRGQGLPITGVYMWPESTHHLMVVGVKNAYSNIATQIAQLAFGSKLGPWFHMIVVVDDECDIYNKDEVIHRLCTRCHPAKGIRIFRDAVGTPLYPFLDPHDRLMSRGAQVLFDCLFPLDWEAADVPTLVSFRSVYPKEVQERVLDHWRDYGFKD